MAKNEKIKVVGVELRADGAAEFKKTNSEVKAEIDKIFASLRKEQQELKNTGSETEKLQSKKKNYIQAVQAQEKIVNNLKEALNKEKEAGKISKEETLKLEKAILNAEGTLQRYKNTIDDTETSLKNLGSEAESASKDVSSMEDSTKKISDVLSSQVYENVASKAKDVSDSIIDIGKSSIESAATVQATNAQFEQVFGDMESKAQESVEKIGTDMGILPTRLKETFTKMAAFAKTTGMDTADALSLSDRATRAAADSAAFYDKKIEDTSESLQSFLKGNYANDAALGISATETTRNAKANELYGESFNKLSEAQKQLTLLAMVEDGNKLSGAMGQAAREMDGYENVMGNVNAAQEEFMATIGETVLPIFIELMQTLAPIIKDIAEWFKNLSPEAKTFMLVIVGIIVVVGQILPLIASLNTIILAMGTTWGAVFGALASPFVIIPAIIIGVLAAIYLFRDQIQGVFTSIQTFLSEKLGVFGDILNGIFIKPFEAIFQTIVGIIDGLIMFITGVFTGNWEQAWQGIVNIFGSIFNGIVNLIAGPLNLIIRAINWVIGGLNKIKLPDWVPGIGGFGINIPMIPEIPKLADGGILTKATLNIAGEAGTEAVVPMTNAGVQRQLADFIVDGIKNIGGLANGAVDSAIEVIVNLDGKTIATELNPALNGIDTKQFNFGRRSNLYGKK